MRPVGFGVIGARSFVAEAAVLPAIVAGENTFLAAASSLSGALDDRWAHKAVDSYDAVLNHPDVDAVYVPLPNHLHLEWIERCAKAGKHVLCEKPLALSAADAERAATVCAEAGVMCAEAWMTPFHKRWQFMMLHASSGQLGAPTRVHGQFTFTIAPGNETNYRLDPAMGGGAFNDVGIYCLGPAVKLWGAEPDEIRIIKANMVGGVDRSVSYELRWNDGRTAVGVCSFEDLERQTVEITCADGMINATHTVHTGGDHNSSFRWESEPVFTEDFEIDENYDSHLHTVNVPNNDPYLAMVERFASAIGGERDWPRPMEDVVAMTRLMDRIRAEIR